ncbi:MAG: hypothetical protein Tsb008_03040 [Rhodothalassiaceae bacterium]
MSDETKALGGAGVASLSDWAAAFEGGGGKAPALKAVSENRTRSAKRSPGASNGGAPAANDGVQGFGGMSLLDETQPFYLATVDGIVIETNEVYRALAAAAGDRLPGPGSGTPGTMVLPAHRAVLDEVAAEARPVLTEETLSSDRGERCWRGRHYPVRGQGGGVIAVAGSYQDVTAEMALRREAMRARRRFSDFARSTSDWFWETDRDGVVLLLSERFAASIGRPAALFYGRRLSEIAAEGPLADALAKTLESRQAFRNLAIEIVAPDGSIRRCHLSGVPVFDGSSGAFSGYRGAGMDVTDSWREGQRALLMQQNLEETLEELTRKNLELDIASAQAESALRAKNEFLAAMSHELRTPLNAVIGFAESMEMMVFGELNEHYRAYSRDIKTAGRHLLSLINDVLDVAVLESDGVTLHLEDLSLKSILEQAVNLIRIRAESRNIDLSGLKLTRDVRVHADDRRCTQIILNLLTNAVKFTPEGGRIGAEIRSGDGMAALTIWDNGIGIPHDMQEKIFDKFQQVTETIYSRKSEGTGLGLHISRELARLMGGDVTVVSTPDVGSRFTVTLPLVKSNR